MANDGRFEDAGQEQDQAAGLPRHLAELAGALNGRQILAVIMTSTCPTLTARDEAAGAASA